MTIPPPPKLHELPAGTKLVAGLGHSTILPTIDFETYSPAGFTWNVKTQRFEPLSGASVKGLTVTGAAVYTQHPDAQVLSCAYDLKDGNGPQVWKWGARMYPLDLWYHVEEGGLLEAWNASFEYWVWTNICVRKDGWPPLNPRQLRCAMAKARAHALPGSLEAAGNVLGTTARKDKEGKRLLTLFSIPRNPTKSDSRTRIYPEDQPADAEALYRYNIQDVKAECEISSLVPDLSEEETEFWLCDQAINRRGIQVDSKSIAACRSIIEQAYKKYNCELRTITNNFVQSASEIQKLRTWLAEHGMDAPSLDETMVTTLLADPGITGDCRRVLEIRQLIGSAAVKKLYALSNQQTQEGRIYDLFIYHSARTGRAAGTGPQPQNFPNSGMEISCCLASDCGLDFGGNLCNCPYCGSDNIRRNLPFTRKTMEQALEAIAPGSLDCLEYYFVDAIATVSSCLRGMFIAAPGHDLICSDYSAIEAVVLAALAGEEWRLDVFRTHGKIYEMSASQICGIPFDEFLLHKSTSGEHHPKRKLGKVAELASGYQGWIGAWKQFGADETMNDDQIKEAILAWRKASPAIVEMWGGQQRDWRREYYGLEGMAIQAVLNPGIQCKYRLLTYQMVRDVLYCTLPSGRHITYHCPRLSPSDRRPDTLALSYEGWNTNPKNGGIGWIRMNTYGGKLTENVVQAVARDILAHAIINLEKSGYPVVLHVHDEIVSEIPEGKGSIEEFEKIMSTPPAWAATWPIRASGGWRNKRYAK